MAEEEKSGVIQADWSMALNKIVKMNEELFQIKQQQHQFKLAIDEITQVKEDIKNSVINKILVPTIGNNFIQINAKNDKYGKMLNERMDQFDTSLKSINVQVKHREDLLNEELLKLYIFIGNRMKEYGLEVPKQ